MHRAHRNKEYGYWEYRGCCIERPEGCSDYNIRKIENGDVDWCFALDFADSFKRAKETIDWMLDHL